MRRQRIFITFGILVLVCILFVSAVVAIRSHRRETQAIKEIQTQFPGMSDHDATEMRTSMAKYQKQVAQVFPLYEGLRRGDTNAVAALMAYAKNGNNPEWERARAVQAIGRLGTREGLLFECSFLNSSNGQVRVSALSGLPEPLQDKLFSIYSKKMTPQEFEAMRPAIEREIDAYLASETNSPGRQ